MGIGVKNDSTFVGILQTKLDSVKIFCPALIGYSSKDYLNIVTKLIEKEHNELAIKKLFIFWCLNDIYSNYPTKDSPDIRSRGMVGKFIQLLSRNLKTWHLLKYIFTDRQKDYYDYDKQFYTLQDTNFTKSMEDIYRCLAIASEHGIDTKLILLPYEYQIRFIRDEKNHKPQKLIKQKLSETNIQVIDILELIRNYNIYSKSLYLFGDGIHFSNKGHKFIAELLLKNRISANPE